ncbi:Serine/Threonine protein kinase, catalytic domain [Sarracenia purpurea var. burkii]
MRNITNPSRPHGPLRTYEGRFSFAGSGVPLVFFFFSYLTRPHRGPLRANIVLGAFRIALSVLIRTRQETSSLVLASQVSTTSLQAFFTESNTQSNFLLKRALFAQNFKSESRKIKPFQIPIPEKPCKRSATKAITLAVASAMGDGEGRHDGGDVPTLELSRLKVISALGRGAKGVVFLVRIDQSSGSELLALKAISRDSIEKNIGNNSNGSDYRRICFEQEVLSCFDHPLLPKLRGVIATDKIVGYAIDYCPGRDLNSLRKKQTEKMFSDDIIRFYAAELVLALEYLHGLGIVYRDLKPENVMIQESGHLMLVDFDLSKKLSVKSPESLPDRVSIVRSVPVKKKKRRFLSSCMYCNSGISPESSETPPEIDVKPANRESVEKSNSFVGTEEYVAPEVILGNGHDFAVDWWCLGIVLYEMLYGTTPFRGSNRKETFYRVLAMSPELVGEQTPLRDLIGKLLEKDPKQRISLERIKGHDFFRGVDWDLILQIARPPYVPSRPEDEGTEGNKGIDVESFVQGVFKIGCQETMNMGETRGDSESKRNKENMNNGVWVEVLNQPSQTCEFIVF